MSRPRRPRLRRSTSAESAMCCNSSSTKRGTIKRAADETRLRDIGHAPVDDHARIEDNRILPLAAAILRQQHLQHRHDVPVSHNHQPRAQAAKDHGH